VGSVLFVAAGGVIMLLLMVYNKQSKNHAMLLLIAAFLLQANPLYVLMVYGVYFLRSIIIQVVISARGNGTDTSIELKRHTLEDSYASEKSILAYKPESLGRYIASLSPPTTQSSGSTATTTTTTTTVVDVILIGNDLSTLYTAGLLSQAGKKCLVLELTNSQPIRVVAKSHELPIAYLENLSVGNPVRSQMLFENVLRLKGSCNQKRVVLTPIGSSSEGFAHTIIHLKHPVKSSRKEDVVILRSGQVCSVG
jgi:hypothetical protein